jgi:hypothetical protein
MHTVVDHARCTLVDDAIVTLIVSEAIAPHLRELEAGLGKTLRVSVHQFAPSEGRDALPFGPSDAVHEGVARIPCRRNYGGDRLLVRAHVLFGPEVAPGTGVSGFCVDGWIELAGPRFVPRGYANLYNQPELPTRVR